MNSKTEQAVRNMTEKLVSLRYKFTRLWANPTGNGLLGKAKDCGGGRYMVNGGRRVKFGGPDGASDFLGVTAVEITPEMVGKKLGIITCIETKKPDWKPPTKGASSFKTFVQQYRFIKMIRALGGIAGFVRNQNDLVDLMEHQGYEQEKYLNVLEAHIRKQTNG